MEPIATPPTPSPVRMVVLSPTLVALTESPNSAAAKSVGKEIGDALGVNETEGLLTVIGLGILAIVGGGLIYYFVNKYRKRKAGGNNQEQVPNEDLDEEEQLEMQISNHGAVYTNEENHVTLYTTVPTEQ